MIKKPARATWVRVIRPRSLTFPGTYSLYPKRSDEWVTYKVLLQQDPDLKVDMVVLLVDASNLRRNLLFCSQIIDLKIPVVIALTMMDLAAKKGIEIDVPGLERELGVPVVPVNPRKNKGMLQLKKIHGAACPASAPGTCHVILFPTAPWLMMPLPNCDR